MPKPIPDGYHTITPTITLKDTRKAIAFYKKAFGAEELRPPSMSPDGKSVMHAELRIGNSMIMLNDEMGDQCKSAETSGGSPAAFYLYVDNADAAFKKAVDAGAAVVMPVQDMFWGDRWGQVKDPFGYSWSLATHKKDVTPEEIRKGSEAMFAGMAKK